MIDVVHQGRKPALGYGRDPICHFLRRDALVIPNNADDGNVDFRKNVGRGMEDDDGAENQQQHGHHNEGVWPAQC